MSLTLTILTISSLSKLEYCHALSTGATLTRWPLPPRVHREKLPHFESEESIEEESRLVNSSPRNTCRHGHPQILR